MPRLNNVVMLISLGVASMTGLSVVMLISLGVASMTELSGHNS